MNESNSKRKRSQRGYILRFALMACPCMFLAACSSNDDVGGNGGDDVGASAVGATVYNDPSYFDGRVTLYKGNTRATRAGDLLVTMPDMPAINKASDSYVTLPAMVQNQWNPSQMDEQYGSYFEGKTIHVEKGTTCNLNVWTYGGGSNSTLYVEGTVTLTNDMPNTIYVMEGGVLDMSKFNGISHGSIYNYGGTVTLKNGSDGLTMNAGTTFMTTGDLSVDYQLKVQGTLYVGGNLSAGTLDQSYGYSQSGEEPNVTVGGDVTLAGTSSVSSGSLYVGEALSGTTLNVVGGTTNVTVGCSAKFTEKLYLTSGSTFNATNGAYVQSPYTEISAWGSDHSSTLAASDNTLLDLGDLKLCNVDHNQICVVGDNSKVVVIAKDINVNNEDLTNTFTCPGEGSCMGLEYKTFSGNNNATPDNVTFVSNVKVTEEELANMSIPATEGCNPGYNAEKKEVVSTPVIDQIADIAPDGHSHDISATCVQINNDKAYVSWHARGTGHSGCIEVVDHTVKDAPQLVSFMRSNSEEMEYNHLIVDNGMIYAVGNSKKGGLLSCVKLNSDGIFAPSSETVDTTLLSYVILQPSKEGKSSDGNCIVRQGSDFLVATSVGFETFDATTLARKSSSYTAGSVKHIALDGDNMVTLNLAGQNTSDNTDNPLGAVVSVWNASDHTFGTPTATWTNDYIVPTNGKNVCRIDGSSVYACLGQNGFVRYDIAGNKTGEFKLSKIKVAGKTITGGSANGVDFDSKYIYVAYGTFGVRVLDKNTLEEVASYTFSGGKSANYVKAGTDGYVYVAYGKSGVKIFRIH